jgi:hypothetical protein
VGTLHDGLHVHIKSAAVRAAVGAFPGAMAGMSNPACPLVDILGVWAFGDSAV